MKCLRLLWYLVERNVSMHGCQIDLYAEYQTGTIRLRLMIECKDYRNGQAVGVKEIKEFIGALTPALGHLVDKGLIVSQSEFTREAKNLAASTGIELVRLQDLEHKLVDFEGYTDQVIKEHTNSPAYPCYIDLSATSIEDFEGAPPDSFQRPIDTVIDRLLFGLKKQKLALLGNFGTGKTTFCRKYAHDLALKYRENPDDPKNRIPIVIQLKDYESRLDIQELITNTFQFRYAVRLDIKLCEQLQKLGRLLILLDGFDEMSTRVDPEIVQDNIRELNKLARIPENKFIITCRTHFLVV